MTATLTRHDQVHPDKRWAPPDPATRRRSPRTRRTSILVALATVAALASVPLGNSGLLAIPLLFALAWPFERFFRRHPVPVRRLALRTDLAYAAAQPALQAVTIVAAVVVAIASFAWLPALALRPFVAMLPPVAKAVIAFLLFDMLSYWTHRWGHTVPLFWRFHAVHHSTTHLDWISGFRAHPFDGLFVAPIFIFLFAAGFDARLTGALVVLQFLTGLGAHLNVRFRLRPLWRVVLTPEFHHWHHELDPVAHHTNYSVFLPLWDQVFGTYRMPRDERPQRYGISGPMPAGILGQLAFPVRGARSDWRQWRADRRARRSERRACTER